MPAPILAIFGSLFVMGNFASSAMHFFPPLWNAWQKWSFTQFPNVNPQVVELVEMLHREEITEAEYLQKCLEFGYDNDVASKLFNISKDLLTAADYISLWRRGEITENEADNKLRQMHLGDREIQLAKQATVYYPNPNDLVRFAVREVYTPDIVQRFGLLEDLPADFIQEANKVGLREENAKQYWAAHWELPSALMGFEMFHRRIIDEDTLKVLLRALDVMPYWRDKLVQLSYNPLTRVDVRRMYGLGVLDEEGVYNSYLDIGYSPENAERMMEFTVLYESDEFSGITRSSVISAFKKDILTEQQLVEYLKNMGYAQAVVEFWVSMAKAEKASEEVDAYVDEITARYLAGIITLDQARDLLTRADLPSAFIATTINKLKSRQSDKSKIPSKTDLEKWLKLQLIDESDYAAYMTRLGYDRDAISLYLSEVALEQDTKKVKYLPLKTYERWYSEGIISSGRFASILQSQGYSQTDINLQLQTLAPAESE